MQPVTPQRGVQAAIIQTEFVEIIGYLYSLIWNRVSSVGIATRYGLDGPVSNPGGDVIFRTRTDRPWGLPCLLYNG